MSVMAIDLLKLFLFTTLRVPNSGTIHGSFANSQASAICAGVAPLRVATAATPLTSLRLASRASLARTLMYEAAVVLMTGSSGLQA